MALKGRGSFSIKTDALDKVLYQIKTERQKSDKILLKKVTAATEIVWRLARARRPMISKTQMKAEGRSKRVSDPNAEAGVPVQTGALQESIKKEVKATSDSIVGRIFTKMYYAPYIEFGTSKMKARPFMRPALDLSHEKIKQLLTKENA